MQPISSPLRWILRGSSAAAFFLLFILGGTYNALSQSTGETNAQKIQAIRDAGLYKKVDRYPRGYNQPCNMQDATSCPSGLRCVHINITYRDGSQPYSTFRCVNRYCTPMFINLMLRGHPNASSQQIIESLRDQEDGEVAFELGCSALNNMDPQSANYGRRQ